jgi:hypothetical protein
MEAARIRAVLFVKDLQRVAMFYVGALEGARANYLRELGAWRNRQPRTQGALAESMHDLEVAKRRLQRFEREVCGDLTARPTATGIPAARRPIRKSTSVG